MKSRWPATPPRVGWAELCEAQHSAYGSRSASAPCVGLPYQAGSRPGWRPTFLWQQESRQRSAPRFNAARFAHGPLRCSNHRVSAQLALAALGARTVLATAALRASEPDASALLGVSEGEGKASTFLRCLILVARMLAVGQNPGDGVTHPDTPASGSAALHPSYEQPTTVAQRVVLTFGSRRERRVAERDREEGRGRRRGFAKHRFAPLKPAGCAKPAVGRFEHRAQRGRVPQAPSRASNAGESDTQCLTANAGSPFLGYFFWRSKRSNTPAGGGTPANARLQINNTNCKPQSRTPTPSVGLRKTQPNLRNCRSAKACAS